MEMLGLLKIRVHKGINLPLKDTFHSDPYVVVSMGDQRVKTRYTFSRDDKIGEAEIDIKPYLEALEMSYHQDLPDGVKVDKVQPGRDNSLAKESFIIWENGKMIQDMTLMLQNVQCGEVKLQIEVIPKMLSEDTFFNVI
ncbi:hypothetical protein BC332_13161 [Capsicum chinense]|nr:hypothetical protein BC332_13161 [Capsicum chinense]